MDLQYKGVNSRTGRVEWIERDLAPSTRPEGIGNGRMVGGAI
ncbi:hypothetical protein [Paenibacillus peoriae]|nr:hypothetical protein [Paenibacillus peoriae]